MPCRSRPLVDEPLLRRVVGEYLQMPGLPLTVAQAARLWGVDEPLCVMTLNALVERGFLLRRPKGRFGRLTDGVAQDPKGASA